MGLMKIIEDFENDEITLIEYQWAYDGWLCFEVNETKKRYHRYGNKIVENKQTQEYWPVYFKCEWNKFYRNLKEVTEEEYNLIK